METTATTKSWEPGIPEDLAPPWLPRALLAAAMVATAAALAWILRGTSFFADEWGFFTYYPGFHLHAMLEPRIGHLQLVPILLYKAVLAVNGSDGIGFRIVHIALILTCAGLAFELMRQRVGEWLALAGAIFLLGFGASGAVEVSTIGITVTLAIAGGLGALLCVARRDLYGDIAACVLLTIIIATYATSLAFVAGVAVAILFATGPGRWRRAWVFGVPIVLYGVWLVWALPIQGAGVSLDSLATLPSSLVDSLAAGALSVTGLSRSHGVLATEQAIPLDKGYVLIPFLVALAVIIVRARAGAKLDPWIWVFLAMPLVYWAAIGADDSGLRPPEEPKYQYLSAIFLLLLFAELARGIRISRAAGWIVVAVLAVGLFANLANLRDYGRQLRANSNQNRGELAALELVRQQVDPDFHIEQPGVSSGVLVDMDITAGRYFDAADAYGSVAMPLDQAATSTPDVRFLMDELLIRALGITTEGARGSTPTGRGRVEIGEASSARLVRRGNCVHFLPSIQGGAATLALPPGGASVVPTRESTIQLGLRRFGDSFMQLPSLAPGTPEVIRIPPDESTRPWLLQVQGGAPASVCPLAV
jgi:hypothetical protein